MYVPRDGYSDRMESEPSPQLVSDVAWVSAGVVAGLTIGFLALLFTGAGHGWGSGVISALSIFAAPLAGLSWSRRRTLGIVLGGPVTCFALLLDLALLNGTINEGTNYFALIWERVPGLLLLWASMFAAWQIAAIAAAVVDVLEGKNREPK
jgi:hypothetical protein